MAVSEHQRRPLSCLCWFLFIVNNKMNEHRMLLTPVTLVNKLSDGYWRDTGRSHEAYRYCSRSLSRAGDTYICQEVVLTAEPLRHRVVGMQICEECRERHMEAACAILQGEATHKPLFAGFRKFRTLEHEIDSLEMF